MTRRGAPSPASIAARAADKECYLAGLGDRDAAGRYRELANTADANGEHGKADGYRLRAAECDKAAREKLRGSR